MTGPSHQVAPAIPVSRGEWRWVALASALVMTLTCLPYLFGWYITPPGLQYMGLLANPDEHNVYLGWMRQAERGHLLFLDPFTTEPQQAGFFHGFFLTLGLLARLTHLPLIWVYHVARVISGMLLLGAVYALAAQLFQARLTRRLAWGFAAFSSGLGWIYALARPGAAVHPIDFGSGLVMPEAITFLSLLLNPLFCFSVFLMTALFTAYLVAVRINSWRYAVAAGVAALALGNLHTYDVFTVWLTLAIYVVVTAIIARRLPVREAVFAGFIAIMATPFVLYQYWLFQTNQVFRDKALTLTLTPPPAYFLLGYGLVLALAIPGALVALRRPSIGGVHGRPPLLLVAWAAATLLLVFLAPFSFQRKLAEGLHIPLSLLAALFVGTWAAPRMKQRTALALAILAVIATAPSNIFFMARGVRDLVTNNSAYLEVLMPPLYLRSDTVGAMAWLRDHTHLTEGVLCMPLRGSYIPGVAGNTVFVGHWAETLYYPKKLAAVKWFFSDAARPQERRQLMERNGLRYLLYTSDESAIGDFDPAASPQFEPVFMRPQAKLYRLVAE